MELESLVRKNILSLRPYTSARDQFQDGIFLDANENSLGSVIKDDVGDLNRYPDPHQKQLREELSKYLNINSSKLFFGVGSDEIIDLVIRIFCEPGKSNVVIPQPTYGMYRVACDINNVKVKDCKLDANFDLDVDAVLKVIDGETKIIFLCSPNNPTGNLLDNEKIKTLAKSFNGIIFIDEAYIEFSENDSFLKNLSEFKNLIISRTFSKAWGLAGVRCGYCIADEFVIDILFKVKAPYTINRLTANVILKSINAYLIKDKFVSEILIEKEKLISAFMSFDFVFEIYPSDANFILVKMKNAIDVYNYLNQNGIRVRMRKDDERLKDSLRITIGNKEENELLIKTLKAFK
jgi:histidinol-phosphate aminotransferase